jgi:hypothetical protein
MACYLEMEIVVFVGRDKIAPNVRLKRTSCSHELSVTRPYSVLSEAKQYTSVDQWCHIHPCVERFHVVN